LGANRDGGHGHPVSRSWKDAHRQRIAAFFSGVEHKHINDRQTRQLNGLPSKVDDIFDEEEEKESLAKVLLPFLLLGFKKGVDQGLAQGSGNVGVSDVFTDAVKLALKQKSFEHAAQAIGTTRDELQALIQQAIAEGQSVSQLAKRIKDQYGFDSRVRPLRIARTELTDTINDGTVTTLRKEGYQQKQWSTVIDGRERETHAAADGQTVGINDVFRVGGESCRYPGDEMLSPALRVNCRCVCVASGLPEDRVRRLGEMFLRTHGQLEKSLVVSLRREFERQRKRVLSHFPTP
jgi:SPP1 gp7 family putative phage head morphogenesis protein